jgi:hypothetical protein
VLDAPRSLLAIRLATGLLFVGSAAVVAAILEGAWAHPLVATGIAATLGSAIALRWWAQEHVVRRLKAGDLTAVLDHWSGLSRKLPHPATTLPIMRATVLAAFGRLRAAREALDAAERGPAWEAAAEHRLLVDVLLATFDGDLEGARAGAARLATFPLPENDGLRAKLSTLRASVASLARAFDHQALPGDIDLLERASEESPLVHWAMRYGAAVAAIDAGDASRARRLLEDAPPWPADSAFAGFQEEIGRLVGIPPVAQPPAA